MDTTGGGIGGDVPEQITSQTAGDFLERLGRRMGGRELFRAVYGDPIQQDGITIIPVARVGWGFGGGFGSSPDRNRPDRFSQGAGGGGGGSAVPIGWIEISGGTAKFKQIRDPVLSITAATVIHAALVNAPRLIRAVRRLRRA